MCRCPNSGSVPLLVIVNPWKPLRIFFFGNFAIAVILSMEIEARRMTGGRGKERASIARQEAVSGAAATTTRECAKELTLRSGAEVADVWIPYRFAILSKPDTFV